MECIYNMDCRIVESVFFELDKNVVSRNVIQDRPRFDEHGVYIKSIEVITLSDGTEVEICLWSDLGYQIYDISVNKEAYDKAHSEPFEQYMSRMGLYTENIKESYREWMYTGYIDKPDCYRLQYYYDMED